MLIGRDTFLSLRRSRSTLQRTDHDRLRLVIAELRVAVGLSRRQLSLRLGKAPTFIARVERGERALEVFEFVDVCTALGADPAAILKSILKDA